MVSTVKQAPGKRGRKPKKAAAPKRVVFETSKKPKKWDVTSRDWTRYQKLQTTEARQELIGKYLPLVRTVAARMAMGFPRSVELTDLVNTGVIGLIEAFGNFD